MRHLPVLAALAIATTSPATAQAPATASPPPADCQSLVAGFDMIETSAETVIEDIENGCRITNFHLNAGSYMRYRAERLELTAPDFFVAASAFRPFAALDLTLTGLRPSPDAGGPLTTYIIEMQSAPLDARISYRWDEAAQTLDLSELSLRNADFGGFTLSGHLSGIVFDREALDSPANWPGALDRLTLTLHDGRFFTAFAAPAILGLLPYDADPRPLIVSYQAAATAFVDGLPEASVSEASKAALRRFITDFPHPRGEYELGIDTEKGLPLTDLFDGNPAGLVAILAKISVTATHLAP